MAQMFNNAHTNQTGFQIHYRPMLCTPNICMARQTRFACKRPLCSVQYCAIATRIGIPLNVVNQTQCGFLHGL